MDGMNTAERHGIRRSVGTGMQVNPSANLLNAKLDVQHFRLLAQTKPRTKAGQLRQVWPEIKAALGAGHRFKDIRQWLSEIGVEIGYARLSDYVGQLKRREAGLVAATAIPAAGEVAVVQDKPSVSHRRARSNMESDPLSNLQEHERRPALFAFNPRTGCQKTDLIQGESKHGKNIDNGNRFERRLSPDPCRGGGRARRHPIHLTLQGKGGVGKSLVAVILAQYLSQRSGPRCANDLAHGTRSFAAPTRSRSAVGTAHESIPEIQRPNTGSPVRISS
jgi:hypothetical protein